MSYDHEHSHDVPEAATTVDAVQSPALPVWTWDLNKVLIVAAGAVGVGLAVWFLMQYTKEKAKAESAGASSE